MPDFSGTGGTEQSITEDLISPQGDIIVISAIKCAEKVAVYAA